MNASRVLLFWLLFLVHQCSVATPVAVLIHGYLAEGSSWRTTGIVYQLNQAGWQDNGHLLPTGPVSVPKRPLQADQLGYLYTLTLPSEAPLPLQSQWLSFYLDQLQRRHASAEFILIGHSAGGVVARLTTVKYPDIPIVGLMTIASPHLGSDKAELGIALSNSPLGWFAPFWGLDTLNRSEELYRDLMRESPATPLFWLNRQPHPPILYAAIVRVGADRWVAPYSQDLNDVPALQGQAITVVTVGKHALHPADGSILVPLLDTFLAEMGE